MIRAMKLNAIESPPRAGPGRHGHPQWNPGKPKSFSNGTMFILDKELENLAQLQGGQPQIHLTLTLRDVI